MDDIGKVIRELRGSDFLREASRKIGISHTYLDTIEKGFDKRLGGQVNPSPDTLKLITTAYKYSYENLLVLAGYIDEDDSSELDEKTAIMDKVIREFPDADLMFNDLANFNAEDMQDVYDFIKFK